MEIEIWKYIEGFDNLYMISSEGRIKSFHHSKDGKILKLNYLNRYPQVQLWKDNRWKNFAVHRLVAKYFIPNPLNLPELNHKNRDRNDFSITNLEWCDHFYNMDHAHAKEFKVINPDGKIVEFRNLNKFCRDNNLGLGNMYSVLNGKRNQHKGWRKYD